MRQFFQEEFNDRYNAGIDRQQQSNFPEAQINNSGGLGKFPTVRVEQILNGMIEEVREIERCFQRSKKTGTRKHKRGPRTLTASEPYRPKNLT